MKDLSEPLLGGKEKISKKDADGFLTPRWHGYVYQFLVYFTVTINQTAGKYLFLRNPNLNPFQLLLVGQALTALIFSVVMNVNFKHYMYDCIDRKVFPLFLARVGCQILMLVCVYTAILGLPPVYVALTSNFSPLLTALFSFILFKVAITKLDI